MIKTRKKINSEIRKKIYLESAKYFAIRNNSPFIYINNNINHDNGICFDLKNRGMNGYGGSDDNRPECPEIYLFTWKYNNKEICYNDFHKDDKTRVIALLFAACMCDD